MVEIVYIFTSIDEKHEYVHLRKKLYGYIAQVNFKWKSELLNCIHDKGVRRRKLLLAQF